MEGAENSLWVLVDYVSVVVHIFPKTYCVNITILKAFGEMPKSQK